MVCVPQPHSLWTYNALHSQPANQIHSLTENESHWLHACALLSTLAKQKSSSSNIHCVNWPHITLLASKQTLLFSTTKSPCFYIKSKEASEMSHANCWHSALCHIATKMLRQTHWDMFCRCLGRLLAHVFCWKFCSQNSNLNSLQVWKRGHQANSLFVCTLCDEGDLNSNIVGSRERAQRLTTWRWRFKKNGRSIKTSVFVKEHHEILPLMFVKILCSTLTVNELFLRLNVQTFSRWVMLSTSCHLAKHIQKFEVHASYLVDASSGSGQCKATERGAKIAAGRVLVGLLVAVAAMNVQNHHGPHTGTSHQKWNVVAHLQNPIKPADLFYCTISHNPFHISDVRAVSMQVLTDSFRFAANAAPMHAANAMVLIIKT